VDTTSGVRELLLSLGEHFAHVLPFLPPSATPPPVTPLGKNTSVLIILLL